MVGNISLVEEAASSLAGTEEHQELPAGNESSVEHEWEPHVVEEEKEIPGLSHKSAGIPTQAMHGETTSSLPSRGNSEAERNEEAASEKEAQEEFGGFDEDDSGDDKSGEQQLHHFEVLCLDEKLTGKSQSLHDNLLQHPLQKG